MTDQTFQLAIPRNDGHGWVWPAEDESVLPRSILRPANLTYWATLRPANPGDPRVALYAAAMLAGSEFPPIILADRGAGEFRLADGVHRYAAARKIGRSFISAKVV